MTSPVLVDRDGAVATVTLNRPERLNAIDRDMGEGLRDTMLALERDGAVRAVVLKGAGDGFMAGGDVRVFHEHMGKDLDRVILDLTLTFHDAIVSMRRMPKPLIASVHGACAGAGFSTAMACDLVIAADTAFFTLAYSMLGASPDGSSTYFLPRLVGMHKAMELTLLSDRFDAATAAALGLVNFVVPQADLAAETDKLARRLASGPTRAYARAKALLNRSLDSGLADQLDAEAQGIAACSDTADFAEGVAAFLGKRKPSFKGA
jgi:2-(1,2-epoxy-1,2-dihydrophenyl)acetyl-CoA isomerase